MVPQTPERSDPKLIISAALKTVSGNDKFRLRSIGKNLIPKYTNESACTVMQR